MEALKRNVLFQLYDLNKRLKVEAELLGQFKNIVYSACPGHDMVPDRTCCEPCGRTREFCSRCNAPDYWIASTFYQVNAKITFEEALRRLEEKKNLLHDLREKKKQKEALMEQLEEDMKQ